MIGIMKGMGMIVSPIEMSHIYALSLSIGIWFIIVGMIECLKCMFKDKEPRYKQGDIVLVDTHDICHGHVVVPAVIRYYVPENKAYEVFVLITDGEFHTRTAVFGMLRQWPLQEREIRRKIGTTIVERP